MGFGDVLDDSTFAMYGNLSPYNSASYIAPRNINSRLGEGTTTTRTVKLWFARFASENTDFEEKPRSGRPHTVGSAILDAVKENPEINTRGLAGPRLQKSAGSMDPSQLNS
ncbi:hypothetical protein RB195_023733 [Necator americanus]